MSVWPVKTIGEVCKKVTSGGTPLTTRSDFYLNGTVPWLKTKEIDQRRIYSTENYITQLGVENSSAKIVPVNTVTVAMYGDGKTAGRVGLIKIPLATNQACCNLIIDEEVADPEYVFYLLRGSYDELVARKTGSGQQNLNAKLIKSFEFAAPPLAEQKAVALTLASLDGKIDLLHSQNQTLESMAETLFRQWFEEQADSAWVDFSVGQLADHLKISVKPDITPDQIYSHYSLPAFDVGKTPIQEPGSKILSNKFKVEPWVILVSKLNPRVPRIWPVGDLPLEHSAVCSTEFQVLKPKSKNLFAFLYCLLSSRDARDALTMAASGTSGSHQRVRPEDILNLKTTLPSVSLAEEFSHLVQPLIDKQFANTQQAHKLASLRDTLLPKLMSGEVRVAC